MSIIHDALKKVQHSTPANDGNMPKQEQATLPESAPLQVKKINIPLAATIIAILVTILIATWTYAPVITTLMPAKQKSAAPTVPAHIQPPPPRLMETTPEPLAATPHPAENINVEGILEMNGKKAVLINGEVYEEGQMIDGKKITSITFNSLTIDDNGTTRTIDIKP